MSPLSVLIAIEDLEIRSFLKNSLGSDRFCAEQCLGDERRLWELLNVHRPGVLLLGYPNRLDPSP